MLLQDLKNKKIMIWGLGTEGQSVLRYLKRHDISRDIIIYNDTPMEVPEEFCACVMKSGEDLASLLNSVEVVIKSPGVSVYKDEIIRAKANGVYFTSSTDLCFSEIRLRQPHCKIIAITGSKGKSTSVSALYHMMTGQRLNVGLGGNIGRPLIELIDGGYDYIVAEISSYQAADLTVSPHIAMFTNLFLFIPAGTELTTIIAVTSCTLSIIRIGMIFVSLTRGIPN